MNPAIKVSVIICTHNRAANLQQCLHCFEGIEAGDDVQWELVIVDNNSNDTTRPVIAAFARKGNLPIKYVYEGRPGLGHARNAGIARADGDILAFTDDDCIVDGNWLRYLADEFKSDSALNAIGGRVELFDRRDKPVTIITRQDRITFTAPEDVFTIIHGCNMAFSRKTFDVVGNFDARFGAGTRLASAEDLDFLYRVFKKGLKIVYSPDVLVYHNHGRRTDEEVWDLTRGYTVGRGAFYCKHSLGKDEYALKHAYWEIRSLIGVARNGKQKKDRRKRARDLLSFLLLGSWHFLVTACFPLNKCAAMKCSSVLQGTDAFWDASLSNVTRQGELR